jgi:hypothetical protein
MTSYAQLQKRQSELCAARSSLVPIVIASKQTIARCDDVLAEGPGTGFSYLHAWQAKRSAHNTYLSAVAQLVDVESELDKIETQLKNSSLAYPLPNQESHEHV